MRTLLAATVALALCSCAVQDVHRSSKGLPVPPPSATGNNGQLFLLAPVHFSKRKVVKRKRIRIPERVVKGCYRQHAEVRAFGEPPQSEYVLALDRETTMFKECIKLQDETKSLLLRAIYELRHGN